MNTAKEIKTETVEARGIKFSLSENEQEVARAYLYIMHNELHQEPFGLLEDVYVDERYRGLGWGTKLVQQVITAAKEQNCYKLIAIGDKLRKSTICQAQSK